MPASNLPLQLTTFVGREREAAEVTRLLADVRLLSLVGAGGVGKTRLALRVGEDLLESFPDGVWLVELAALADPSLVSRTVAATFGVSESPGQSFTQTLAHALELKHLLLVLDNCEHLITACAELTEDLLRACPHLRILTTSRQSLGIGGETVWRVPSLSIPASGVSVGTDEIASSEAVRLFMDRARCVLPGFVLDDRNAAAVAQICRRLDGIPLALELAAVQVKVLSPEQILQRLNDGFRLLVGGSRTAPSRQQTLHAMLDWSFELLSEPERVLFARLGVFAGGWTLEAAETVCGWAPLAPEDLAQLLFELVDRSVVLAEHTGPATCYRLLETVRQYALERLRSAGEESAVRDRHQAWYVALAEAAEPELTGPEEQACLEQLEREHDNVRGALDWTLGSGNVEAALRIGGALWKFWVIRGHQAEGQRWLERALAHGGAVSARTRARGLTAAGIQAWSRGELVRARTLHEESLALWQTLDDPRGLARALHNLGNVAADQGDDEAAASSYHKALDLRRELGETTQLPYTLGNLATVVRHQGDYQQALALQEEGLALARAAGDRWAIAHALKYLSRIHLFLGQHRQARLECLASLELFHELGGTFGTPFCLEVLAALEAADKHPVRAARLLGAADGLRQQFGQPVVPVDLPEYAQIEAAVRAQMNDDERFDAARAEGRELTLAAAVTYALAPAEPERAAPGPWSPLSRREREVAVLIGQGLSNREIAEVLVIGERTAEAHVTHILTKLGLRSRAQIAIWAAQRGALDTARPVSVSRS